MANKAAYLTAPKAHPFEVLDAPMPEPGPHELILKTKAVAMNPADAVIQTTGLLITQFPSVLGLDIAGEVVKVGAGVTRFKMSDRVTALALDLDMENGWFAGAFQHFCRVDDMLAAVIPDNVSYAEASVLPAGLCTAGISVFDDQNLNLPLPQLSPQATGKVVLVWGGSSSVGSCAIQLARAAGCVVATTCSGKNMSFCKDLGAKWVFDYKLPTIAQNVLAALEGTECTGVICSVQDPEALKTSAELARALNGRTFVATVIPPGLPLPDGLPTDVEYGFNQCTTLRDKPAGPGVWEHWLTAAMANGSMKCKPVPQIVGKGLEKIQEAVDLMGKGVSASKLVVEVD